MSRPAAILVGAGGHAKVVIDILEESPECRLVGCVSGDPIGSRVMGLPILGHEGALRDLHRNGIHHALVAIGDNRTRERVTQVLLEIGFSLRNAISRYAVISSHARIGKGIAVMPGAVINVDAQVGDGAIVNTGATIDHDCVIGAFAHIAPGVTLCGNVEVGTGAILGVGSQVIPGRTIGAWSVVGAGSVVVRDLPAGCTAMGNPARIRK